MKPPGLYIDAQGDRWHVMSLEHRSGRYGEAENQAWLCRKLTGLRQGPYYLTDVDLDLMRFIPQEKQA